MGSRHHWIESGPLGEAWTRAATEQHINQVIAEQLYAKKTANADRCRRYRQRKKARKVELGEPTIRRNGYGWTVTKKVNGLVFERHFNARWQAWRMKKQWLEDAKLAEVQS